MEASKIQFSCANPEKSEKTRKRLQHIVDQEDNKLDFDKHKSNPLPTSILVRVPSLLICHCTKIKKHAHTHIGAHTNARTRAMGLFVPDVLRTFCSCFYIGFGSFLLQKDNIPIRLNAAAILREGKLYQKRELEELKK